MQTSEQLEKLMRLVLMQLVPMYLVCESSNRVFLGNDSSTRPCRRATVQQTNLISKGIPSGAS